MMQTNNYQAACMCCTPASYDRLGRRMFLGLAGVGAAMSLLPGRARSAYGQYDALLLTCIDPRFPERTINYMRSRDLVGKYSQVSLAGASIGVVAPAFKDWRPAFWDNLSASVQLHSVPKVIVLNHRDCGAAAIAYGQEAVATPTLETSTNRMVFEDFRSTLKARHPKLVVETGLMALDGTVQMFTG